MKSANEIITQILRSIAKYYADPTSVATTISELDGLLFQSHWLLAYATDNMDRFIECRTQLFKTEISEWQKIHMSSNYATQITSVEDFGPIINEWQRLDLALGIEPCTQS